jgi:hypothetical protein
MTFFRNAIILADRRLACRSRVAPRLLIDVRVAYLGDGHGAIDHINLRGVRARLTALNQRPCAGLVTYPERPSRVRADRRARIR